MTASIEIVSIATACEMTTLGRTAVWKLIQNDAFPKPISVTGRRKAFVKAEIEAWLQDRIDERDQATNAA